MPTPPLILISSIHSQIHPQYHYLSIHISMVIDLHFHYIMVDLYSIHHYVVLSATLIYDEPSNYIHILSYQPCCVNQTYHYSYAYPHQTSDPISHNLSSSIMNAYFDCMLSTLLKTYYINKTSQNITYYPFMLYIF
jgi:hypothetical protein